MSEERTEFEGHDKQLEICARRAPGTINFLMIVLMLVGGPSEFLPASGVLPWAVISALVIPLVHTLCRKVQALTTRLDELELALQQNNSTH